MKLTFSPAILLTAAVLITAALASAFYIRDLAKEEAAPAATSVSAMPTNPRLDPQSTLSPESPRHRGPASSSEGHPLDHVVPSATTRDFSKAPSPRLAANRPEPTPSREELARRVEMIQRTSEARLARLTRDLNLTEDQQNKVFAILARSSPAYHPSLRIGVPVSEADGPGANKLRILEPGGTSGGAKPGAEDQIFETLDPEQADLLAEQILERDQWWGDIVGLLERDIDQTLADADAASKPASPQTPPVEAPASAPPGSNEPRESTVPQNHGGGNLLDRIGGR